MRKSGCQQVPQGLCVEGFCPFWLCMSGCAALTPSPSSQHLASVPAAWRVAQMNETQPHHYLLLGHD
jgi:hypothetical protein